MKLCGALGRVGDQIADAGAKTQPSCSSTCRPGSLARDVDDQIVAESEQARRPKEWFDIGRNRRNHAESLRGLLMKALHAEPRGGFIAIVPGIGAKFPWFHEMPRPGNVCLPS